jgi:hypothetical protein
MVAEIWLYPDGSRLLELSTQSTPLEAGGVSSQLRAYLVGQGIALSGAQQTKTKIALEFYAAQLKALANKKPARRRAAAKLR